MKNKVDYTQLIYDIREELRNEILIEGEYDKSAIVDSIIKEEDITGNMIARSLDDHQLDVKMVECYDRYMGLLTRFERP
nr:hypothetical protein [uncultured Sphaerochaeta sp.]